MNRTGISRRGAALPVDLESADTKSPQPLLPAGQAGRAIIRLRRRLATRGTKILRDPAMQRDRAAARADEPFQICIGMAAI
jgi:hypothetical protein